VIVVAIIIALFVILALVSFCSIQTYRGAAPASTQADTDMNAATTDMNAVDMNAVDMNAVEVNAVETSAVGNAAGVKSDPKEVIFCDILRDRATRADCDYYHEILAKLEVGAGGVDMPATIDRGDTATISFAISANPDQAPVAEMLGAKPKENVTLKIGRKMAVELQGDGFKIEPVGLQQRDLFIGQGARWDWRVTALKASHYRLLLSAYVVVPGPNDSNKPNLLKTLELTLPVHVTWSDWFDDLLTNSTAWLTKGTNWIKALTAFLLALLALFAIFRRKK